MLAGLRHGRTLGTPLALVVRNRDHKNWTWGMSPWPPEGEPEGKGTKPVTLPRPGPRRSRRRAEVRARRRPRRARARVGAAHRGARRGRRGGEGAPPRDRDRGTRRALPEAGADPAAVDAARKDRDTLGGRVEVRATGVPPGLGSYARKEDRLDARLAAALMGIQAVKGVEIGDGFALAGLRGSGGARRDRHRQAPHVEPRRRRRRRNVERRGDRRPRRDEAAADA